jgi:hypothetical protein
LLKPFPNEYHYEPSHLYFITTAQGEELIHGNEDMEFIVIIEILPTNITYSSYFNF